MTIGFCFRPRFSVNDPGITQKSCSSRNFRSAHLLPTQFYATKNGWYADDQQLVISRWVKSNSHTIAPSFSQSEGNPPRRSRGYIPEAWKVGCSRKCTSVPPMAMTNSRPYLEIRSPSRRRVTENDGEFTLGVIESIKITRGLSRMRGGISQRHIRDILEYAAGKDRLKLCAKKNQAAGLFCDF